MSELSTLTVKEDHLPFVFESQVGLILFLRKLNNIFSEFNIDIPFLCFSHIIRDCNNPDVEECTKRFRISVLEDTKDKKDNDTIDQFKVERIITGHYKDLDSDQLMKLTYCYVLNYINLIKQEYNSSKDDSFRIIGTYKQILSALLKYMLATCFKIQSDDKKDVTPDYSEVKSKITNKDVFLTWIVEGPEYCRKMQLNSEKRYDIYSLEKYSHVVSEDAPLNKQHKKNNFLNISRKTARFQRHVHCISQSDSTLVIPCQTNLLVLHEMDRDRYVATNACNHKQMIISFRVKGHFHRVWTFLHENQNDKDIKLIESPKSFTMGPMKYVKGFFPSNPFSSSSEFYEFGLDRV